MITCESQLAGMSAVGKMRLPITCATPLFPWPSCVLPVQTPALCACEPMCSTQMLTAMQVPVLCLDEATAAMDPVTENEVQDTIARIFQDRTMFIIAHRLDTVIETDKVIVMDAGSLMEMDAPKNLLDNKASMFSKLVDASGPQVWSLFISHPCDCDLS
jgi:hypothetical protein